MQSASHPGPPVVSVVSDSFEYLQMPLNTFLTYSMPPIAENGGGGGQSKLRQLCCIAYTYNNQVRTRGFLAPSGL